MTAITMIGDSDWTDAGPPAPAQTLICINYDAPIRSYDQLNTNIRCAERLRRVMSTRIKLLCLLVPLLASASVFDAHAGATISDRRYWPNEARGSPGQAIEIYPPLHTLGAVLGAEPMVVPRRKVRRAR